MKWTVLRKFHLASILCSMAIQSHVKFCIFCCMYFRILLAQNRVSVLKSRRYISPVNNLNV